MACPARKRWHFEPPRPNPAVCVGDGTTRRPETYGHCTLVVGRAALPGGTADMTRRLRFAVAPPNSGPFGDPKAAADLAVVAERAGWDGYFSWDGLPVGHDPPPSHDPWVILASIAAATSHIRIGTCIAVVPRYKPHLLARTLVSLDVLSEGRLILGVGIGDGGAGFEAFGEPGDARTRAERLDEALEIITRLWSGQEVTYTGKHFLVDKFALSAQPIQRPRIPIWVGGDSAPALRRAARWDGWIGPDDNPVEASVAQLVKVRERLASAGARLGSFSLAWAGSTDAKQSTQDYADAGATWWIEVAVGTHEDVRARVAAGPPRSHSW